MAADYSPTLERRLEPLWSDVDARTGVRGGTEWHTPRGAKSPKIKHLSAMAELAHSLRCHELMTKRALLSPALLLAFLSGCGGGASWENYSACVASVYAEAAAAQPAPPAGPFSAELLQSDPEALASLVKDSVKAEMRAGVANARASDLAYARCERLRPPPDSDSYYDSAGAPPQASAPGNAGADSAGASSASGTNNQVAGVDEADFVKNDNKYIYIVNGSTFRIVEAWPAEEAHEIASVALPGVAKKLFVEGDRALVYSSIRRASIRGERRSGGSRSGASADVAAPVAPSSGASECTYGYDGCIPGDDGTATEISIFDITDRAAPRLVRSIKSSSSLIAARRIGGAVHTVLGERARLSGPAWEAPGAWESRPGGLAYGASEREIHRAYDALLEENGALIDALEIDDILPKWTDSAGHSPELALYQSSMPNGAAVTSVLSIELASDPALKVASVFSDPGWVYASGEALYMAVPYQNTGYGGWYEGRTESELSTIHKFSIGLSARETRYIASGYVKGRVLNQFAMDEHDGVLRVATTTSSVPDPNVHSTISILEDQGDELAEIAKIDDIAKTEDIRSVRFDADRGYIVTFKKTDPLFVFDLADPRAPKMMGELKIPGFSTYMHMMDRSHLLTIGYDSDDHGDFAFFTGVLLQIFDVSDPTEPKLAHKEVIGTRGTSSEALTNHLAFNYFAPKNVLAVPMTICEGGGANGMYGTEMTFSGLMVYDVTAASGFSLRGKVAHKNVSAGDMENDYGYYDNGCYSWWTNARSEVKRSIFMDDWVFSVSDTRIKVNHLDALSTDVTEVPLQ